MMEISCTLGGYAGADGSCELRRDQVRAFTILQGPCPISHENEKIYRHVGNINLHSTSYHFDDPQVGNSLLYDLLENCIRTSEYPRTEFIIHANSEGSPGVDVLTINSACLCLLDAAVQMHYYFGAVSVAVFQDPKTDALDMQVDPDPKLLPNARSVFVFVFRPSLTETFLIGSCSHGRFTLDEFEKALELARGRCLRIFDFIRDRVRERTIGRLFILFDGFHLSKYL
ncbi:Exosome complex exonuclease RRP46 [Aphelenchoides bicaudatus]|nr:Exosome complex exonuclease RRP46 [Aphelenchoides bicaudatus]